MDKIEQAIASDDKGNSTEIAEFIIRGLNLRLTLHPDTARSDVLLGICQVLLTELTVEPVKEIRLMGQKLILDYLKEMLVDLEASPELTRIHEKALAQAAAERS